MKRHYVDDREWGPYEDRPTPLPSLCGLRFVEEATYMLTVMVGGNVEKWGRFMVWSATGSSMFPDRPFVLVTEFEEGEEPSSCLRCLRALTRAYQAD